MVKKVVWSMMLMFAMVTFSQAGSGLDFQEGQWEITVDMEIPGMPMKMPPTTITQCIKKDDLVPEANQQAQECQQKDVTIKGNTVSWTVECNTDGGKMIGKGTATYHQDKMEGKMTTDGQGMHMVSHFKGHRTGACQ